MHAHSSTVAVYVGLVQLVQLESKDSLHVIDYI